MAEPVYFEKVNACWVAWRLIHRE